MVTKQAMEKEIFVKDHNSNEKFTCGKIFNAQTKIGLQISKLIKILLLDKYCSAQTKQQQHFQCMPLYKLKDHLG